MFRWRAAKRPGDYVWMTAIMPEQEDSVTAVTMIGQPHAKIIADHGYWFILFGLAAVQADRITAR